MNKSYSPLRYPGGKTKLYNYVLDLLQVNNLLGETYIEPFAGGAGLALKLLLLNKVKRIVLNDLDSAIYSFWYSVLNYTEDLCKKINNTDISVCEWNKQKSIYNNPSYYNRLEFAFATLYLNRTNISGIINGGIIGGKAQLGKYKIDARFNKKSIINKIETIANNREKIFIYNLDAKDFIKQETLGKYYKTLIYFDPPYVNKGAQLYKNSFLKKDHIELFKQISCCKRKWIVTYDICKLSLDLYEKFRCSLIDLNYSVNKHKNAKEYIFFSDNLILPEEVSINENQSEVLLHSVL